MIGAASSGGRRKRFSPDLFLRVKVSLPAGVVHDVCELMIRLRPPDDGLGELGETEDRS